MTTHTQAVVAAISVVVLVTGAMIYFGLKHDAARSAWAQRCVIAGGVPVPTERHSYGKGTTYSGYVCAQINVIAVD